MFHWKTAPTFRTTSGVKRDAAPSNNTSLANEVDDFWQKILKTSLVVEVLYLRETWNIFSKSKIIFSLVSVQSVQVKIQKRDLRMLQSGWLCRFPRRSFENKLCCLLSTSPCEVFDREGLVWRIAPAQSFVKKCEFWNPCRFKLSQL